MSLAILANTFEDAVLEALAYNRMGELDEQTLTDIAFAYRVDKNKLREAVNMDG